MLGVMEVFRGVLVFGRIAAAHVAALQTQAQVNPSIAHFQAFLATVGSFRCHRFNLIHMRTSRHNALLYHRDHRAGIF
jgi:hypothetical protein